jgi:AcrR family transcriptional regulator
VRPRRNARAALLDALARLFETREPDEVTAAAVSTEAGVAHGTFYRYFANKNEAIVALLDRLREESDHQVDALAAAPRSRAAARSALRAWLENAFRKPERHGGVMRAMYFLSSKDPGVAEIRRVRREALVVRLTAYLTMLVERGFATVADPRASAAVLANMFDGIFRALVLAESVDGAQIAAATDLIEAAIFGRLEAETLPEEPVDQLAHRAFAGGELRRRLGIARDDE